MSNLKPGEFYCFGRIVSPPQTSIHPRVYNGRTVSPKSNTAKKRSKPVDLSGIKRHCDAHPADVMAAKRKAAMASR